MSSTSSSIGAIFSSIVYNVLNAIGNMLNGVAQFFAQNAGTIGELVAIGTVVGLAFALITKLPFVQNILGMLGL